VTPAQGHPPRISETSRPWWEALAREQLSLQRCDSCQRFVFYPRIHCPHCGGLSLTWRPHEGSGVLYTWSAAAAPVSPAFAHLKRPILAIVELAPDVRVPTTLVGIDEKDVRIGMALRPVFDHDSYEGVTLLRYRP
jgi:uncharacterized OB-fold protein